MMNKGEVAKAVRNAVTRFDEWNEVTGAISKGSSCLWELESVIEDSVHIGIRAALGMPYVGIEDEELTAGYIATPVEPKAQVDRNVRDCGCIAVRCYIHGPQGTNPPDNECNCDTTECNTTHEEIEAGDGLHTRKVAIVTNEAGHKEVKRLVDELKASLLREKLAKESELEAMGLRNKWMLQHDTLAASLRVAEIREQRLMVTLQMCSTHIGHHANEGAIEILREIKAAVKGE